jgi:hypothetical protein
MSSRLPTARTLTAAGAVLASSFAGPAALGAQAASPAPVVTIVKVRAPRMAPAFLIRHRMRATVSQYQRVPGLAYKAYTLSDDGFFGGVYLWRDRSSAEAWFNDAWHARVRRERGVDGDVQYLDAPVVLDNEPVGAATSRGGTTIVVLSLLPSPAGVMRERLIAGFTAALPVYRAVPGLLRKYFVITTDGKFGGVYVWATRAAATAHYSDTWRQRAHATYGAVPTLEWFDAPILTPSADSANHVAVVR